MSGEDEELSETRGLRGEVGVREEVRRGWIGRPVSSVFGKSLRRHVRGETTITRDERERGNGWTVRRE